MDIDKLLMLDAEDIDYESLPDGVLKALAICEEPYIATYALGALYDRDREAARQVTLELLSDVEADEQLKAYAIKISSRESWLDEAVPSAIAGRADGPALISVAEAIASALYLSEVLDQAVVSRVRDMIHKSLELPYEQKQSLLAKLPAE